MKKKTAIVILFACLMLIGITGAFWGSSVAQAAVSVWDSCTHGKVDCPYPGDCHSYIDTNSDGICDRSQSEPQDDSSSTAADDQDDGDVAETPVVYTGVSGTDSADTGEGTGSAAAAAENSGNKSSYNFIPILLGASAVYALTWILSRKKVIKQVLHRRIWNLVLLVATVISALLGLFLILNLDFNTGITLPVDILFWHVEAGIAMGIIAVFHIIWHWRYFLKIVKAGP